MATTTTRVGLTKPAGSEAYDVNVVNANSDKLDVAVGALPVTSTTRPSVPFAGQAIHESDTGELLVRNAANNAWLSVGTLAATAGRIARRDTGGVLAVGTATGATHATTKLQMDTAIAAAVAPGAWTTITPTASWTSFIGSGATPLTGPYDAFSYRVEGKRVFLRGWLTNSVAVSASANITGAFLPVGQRPANGITVWPVDEGGGGAVTPLRMEIFTNGTLYTARPVTSGRFINFDGVSFPIP